MYLSVHIRFSAHTMIADIAGEIDMKSGPWLRDFLLRFLRNSGTCLLADLSGVTFIDCAGLRTLIMTRRTAQLHASALRFTALSPAVRRLAELTGRREAIPLTPPGEGRAWPWQSEALAAANGPDVRNGPGRGADGLRCWHILVPDPVLCANGAAGSHQEGERRDLAGPPLNRPPPCLNLLLPGLGCRLDGLKDELGRGLGLGHERDV